MNSFWDFEINVLDNIALISGDKSISYRELSGLVKFKSSLLPTHRSLIFLQMTNDVESIVWYLCCLKNEHPVLLVDAELSEDLFQSLVSTYNPNLIVKNNNLTLIHHNKHDLSADLAVLLSTSGSTGSPKLVRLSRNNLVSNAKSISLYLSLNSLEVAITSMPLHYSFGLSVLNSHLLCGSKIVVTSSSLVSKEFWHLITHHKVTSLSGVPYIWQMLRKMRYERFDTSSIKYITQAGGRLDSETLKYYQLKTSELNQQFFVMYGQTEATARISYLPPELLESKMGSIGIAIPFGKLWIKTSDGSLTDAPFQSGELVYEGPNVMLGYAESLSDLALGDVNQGLLHTGDLGYQDADGIFFITGRAKRFIKVFGLRISLDAIDELLASKGLSAVSSGRDDKLVIFSEPTIVMSSSEIVQFISSTLKINVNAISVYFVMTLPRTSNGKIDGQALIALLEQYE